MSNLKRKSIGILVLWVLWVAGIATTFAAGRTYLQYCSGSVYAPVCSGWYQDDIDASRTKASWFMNEIRSYSSSDQQDILDTLITRLALYHMTTNSAYDQVIASYYHEYFKLERDGWDTQNVDDIIRQLIGWSSSSTNTNSSSYSNNSNRPNDGKFTSITPGSSSTSIRNDRITARGELNLSLVAKERNDVLQNTEVRVVAELFDGNRKVDTVAANERGSYRSLVLSDQFDRVDEIKIYLLCEDCTRGNSYQWNLFNNWRVLDTEEYDVSLTRTTRYNDRYYDDDRYSNDDDDLEIRSLDYEYNWNGREVEVQVEVVVRNIWERDNTLDEIQYEVEVDGRRISTNRYDIDHVRTTCDDRGVDRDDTRNLPIDTNDECTVTVEITFDEDDVEDEYVEVFVEAIARRDDNTSNNEDEVRFRVD